MSSRSRRPERGAAAIEMALVLPFLVMLIFGIVDLGRAFMTEILLTNAAREGSRVAQLTRDAADLGNVTTRAQAAAELDPTTSATVTIAPSTGCTAAATTEVTVTVSTSFNWLFLDNLPGITSPQTLTGTSVIGC
jgi:Flp pilus assembly protein TadG